MLYRSVRGEYQRPYAEFEDIKGPAQRVILLYQASKKGLRPTIPDKTPSGTRHPITILSFLVLKDLLQAMVASDYLERPNLMMVKSMLDAANILYRQNPSEWRESRQANYWNVEGNIFSSLVFIFSGMKKKNAIPSLKTKFTRKQLSTLPCDSSMSMMNPTGRNIEREQPVTEREGNIEKETTASHVIEQSRFVFHIALS